MTTPSAAPFTVGVYDTKPYDQEALVNAAAPGTLAFRFFDFRLSSATASSATGCEAVCVFVNDKVDADCLRILVSAGVRLIALRCAGFNNVDVATAKQLGLTVVRVPAYSPEAVAEHALALLLTLNRHTHRAFNRVRDLNFSLHGLVGSNIHGKTVGIVGTGRIGRATARIFAGFGVRLIGYDVEPDVTWSGTCGLTYLPLPDLLATCDIISLHVPLTPQSKHLINAERLAQMKRGVFLINTSRGKLINTRHLIDALKRGHMGGVALDVYEEEEGIFFEDHSEEPLQDDVLARLLTFPNVLVTAHQAFLTHEALAQIAATTLGNLQKFRDRAPCEVDTLL